MTILRSSLRLYYGLIHDLHATINFYDLHVFKDYHIWFSMILIFLLWKPTWIAHIPIVVSWVGFAPATTPLQTQVSNHHITSSLNSTCGEIWLTWFICLKLSLIAWALLSLKFWLRTLACQMLFLSNFFTGIGPVTRMVMKEKRHAQACDGGGGH